MKKGIVIQADTITSADNRELFNMYLKDMRPYINIMTREDEVALFTRLRNGETHLKDFLITSNLSFVISVAKKYQHSVSKSTISLEDLVSEGNLGLCLAIDKYDHLSGNKFLSYAVFYIKGRILEAIKTHIKQIRIPHNKQESMQHISLLEAELEQKYGIVDPAILHSEAIERGYIHKNSEDYFIMHLKTDTLFELSLSSTLNKSDSDSSELGDVIENTNALHADHLLLEKEKSVIFEHMLNSIPIHVRKIIEAFYGINCVEALTINEIAKNNDTTKHKIAFLIRKYINEMHKKFKYNKPYFA